jgi:ABC-type sugar transport system substrate-binding protein
MEQPARLAVASDIAWGILNYEAPYISTLRKTSRVPVFEVSNDNLEIGRIQAKHASALLPNGGVVLYIEGPSTGGAAHLRFEGMQSAIPSNVELRVLKGDWTQASGRRCVTNWLGLSTSRNLGIAAVICQNDAMALGAREAFENSASGAQRNSWLSLPITGCDGLPSGGQDLVRRGVLAATVIVSPNAGTALELFAGSLKGRQIPARTACLPSSYPPEAQILQNRRTAAAH